MNSPERAQPAAEPPSERPNLHIVDPELDAVASAAEIAKGFVGNTDPEVHAKLNRSQAEAAKIAAEYGVLSKEYTDHVDRVYKEMLAARTARADHTKLKEALKKDRLRRNGNADDTA